MCNDNTGPQVNILAPLTTRASSLINWCVSSDEPSNSKTFRRNLRKHQSKSNLSWNTCKKFLKMPSPWEGALETELAKMFFKSHLGIKCHFQCIKVIRLLPQVTGPAARKNCRGSTQLVLHYYRYCNTTGVTLLHVVQHNDRYIITAVATQSRKWWKHLNALKKLLDDCSQHYFLVGQTELGECDDSQLIS